MKLSELPENWVCTTVGGIYDIVSGGTPSTKVSEYWNGDIPWITSADIHNLKDIRPRRCINLKAIQNSATNLVPDGSLIVVTRVGLGKIALTKIPICFSQDSQALIGDQSLISPDYSLYYLSQAVQIFKYRHRGTTIAGVTKKQLSELVFPLSPLPEQHRIVTKIEELFTQLDAGVGALTNTKAQLKRYRQSVLKSACEGRLVPTEAELARAEGRDYEPADVLLARIQKERRENWEAEKKRKGKKSAMYKEPAAPGVSGLPELPEGWCWATVEQLNPASRPCAYGVLQPGNDVKDGVFLVRVGDISNGRISVQDMKRIKPEIAEQYPRTRLQGGEVLITLVGAIGRTAVVPASLSGANTARAVGVISLNGNVKAEWVEIWFRNPQKIREITSKAHEVARKTLNLEDVRVATVALPPFPEQFRIVAEIERRLSVADETEKTIDQSLKQAERLRQSILKRAFEGKLVPQDPDDEPASVLLERIKAEKAKRGAEKKTKNKRKRKGDPKQKRLI